MLRILVPVDGSEVSNRAIDHLITKRHWYRDEPEIHLLNVQPGVHGDVTMFVSKEQLRQFHHDEGLKCLKGAREKLDAAGISHHCHVGVGDPAHVIAHYARDKQIDEILMGTRGHGSVVGMLLGDVARKVIHLSDVPVLLVK